MRSYYIEEINQDHIKKFEEYLKDQGYQGPIDGIFWLPLPVDMLSERQSDHLQECGPYYLALETGKNWLKLELLVRARGKIRCECIAYATPAQREKMIDILDNMLRSQDIPV